MRSLLVLSTVCLIAFAFWTGCNQAEGDVCDPLAGNGGNDDCQSGLTCQNVPGVNGNRCCPSPGTSKIPACGAVTTFDAGSQVPPASSGTPDAAPADGPIDASGRAPMDAAGEGQPAAPADGSSTRD